MIRHFVFFVLLCIIVPTEVHAGIIDFIKGFLNAESAGVGSKAVLQAATVGADIEDEELKYPMLSEEEFRVLMESSMNALRTGDTNNAMNNLMTILESDPFAHDANLLVGTTLLTSKKRPDLAESFLYRAVTGSGWKDVLAISSLAYSLIQNNDSDLALRVCMEGLRRNIKSEAVDELSALQAEDVLGQLLGLIYFKKEDYVQSSEFYFLAAVAGSKRLRLEPNSVQDNHNVWLKASTLSFPRNHFDAKVAKSVLLEAMKFSADSPVIVYNLGLAHHLNEEQEVALRFYEQAVELDREVQAESAQQEVEVREGETELAARSKIPGVWGSIGTALFSLGELQKAHDSFEMAFRVQPNNHVMLANWAKLLCLPSVGHFQEGNLVSQRASSIDPKNADVKAAVAACAASST